MHAGCTPSAALLARRAIEHEAQQKQSELTGVLRLLERRRLQTVVEIGTARGGTLWAWCQIAQPDSLIVSIDLPGGLFGGGYSEDRIPKLLGFARARQTLRLLHRDSHDEETLTTLKAVLGDRPIDFLFIDGDHAYSGVKLDYEMYSPLVIRGGLIVFHDILPHPHVPGCEVERFWHGIRSDFKHVELVDAHDRGWGGIGVLYAGIGTRRLLDNAVRMLTKAAMRLLSVGEGRLPEPPMRFLRKAAMRLLSTAAVS